MTVQVYQNDPELRLLKHVENGLEDKKKVVEELKKYVDFGREDVEELNHQNDPDLKLQKRVENGLEGKKTIVEEEDVQYKLRSRQEALVIKYSACPSSKSVRELYVR